MKGFKGFWGIIKSKMYYLQKFHAYAEIKQAIDEYMIFYTRKLQKNQKAWLQWNIEISS